MRGHRVWIAAALIVLGCERGEVAPTGAETPGSVLESPFPDACEAALETMGDDAAQAEELCFAGDLDPSSVGENDVGVIDECLAALRSAQTRLEGARPPCADDLDALNEIDIAQEMLADSVETFELLRAAEGGDAAAAQRLLEKLLEEAEDLQDQDMGAARPSPPRDESTSPPHPLASG